MESVLRGISAAPGLSLGPVRIIGVADAEPERTPLAPSAIDAELARLAPALSAAESELSALERGADATAAAIISVQREILADPEFLALIQATASAECVALPWAVHEASAQLGAAFAALADPYLRERATDIRDAGQRLIRLLDRETTDAASNESAPSSRPAVLVAHELTPSQVAALPADAALAFVCETGSATAHTAILARARGIPAVFGVAGAVAALAHAALVVVDGAAGCVIPDPSPDERDRWQALIDAAAAERARLASLAHGAATTLDGRAVEVAANIGLAAEAESAVAAGADGIGLFRTEFLVFQGDRDQLPGEEEQYLAYRTAVAALAGRPLTIRTLDIGGDKEVPALALPREANPFLGWRGLRLCLDRPELLRTQLRALWRAGAHGPLRVMLPMVTTITEIRAARAHVEAVRAELDAAGIPHAATLPLGIMVETPAAALRARQLSREVDFFSLGTNDLTQYTLAVDRTNEHVAALYDPFDPAVLRLIAEVAAAARAAGIWCGICGELAGDPLATPLLIGLGMDELSVSPPLVGPIKAAVRATDARAAAELVDAALACDTAAAVRDLLSQQLRR